MCIQQCSVRRKHSQQHFLEFTAFSICSCICSYKQQRTTNVAHSYRVLMNKMLSSSKLLLRSPPCLRLRALRQFSHTNTSAVAVFNKIAFLGTGKMAQAMIEPLIKTGLQPASQIHVYDVSSSAMKAVTTKYGIQTSKSPAEVVDGADLVVCAVKPQNLTPEFFESLGKPSAHTTLLSVIAGKPMSTFTSGGFTKVARSMPNTPAQIGQGMTGKLKVFVPIINGESSTLHRVRLTHTMLSHTLPLYYYYYYR